MKAMEPAPRRYSDWEACWKSGAEGGDEGCEWEAGRGGWAAGAAGLLALHGSRSALAGQRWRSSCHSAHHGLGIRALLVLLGIHGSAVRGRTPLKDWVGGEILAGIRSTCR